MDQRALQTTRPTVTSIAQHDALFTDQRLEIIRNMVAREAPNDVFLAMIDIAKVRGLDPMSKQIICVPFNNVWTPMVTIDGYRAIADQHDDFAGMDPPVFTWFDEPRYTGSDKIIPSSATVTVYKIVKGVRVGFSATVFWDEFGKTTGNWKTTPAHMLGTRAESHALRKAFPAQLGGIPTQGEPETYIEVGGQTVDIESGEIDPTPPRQVQSSPQQRPQASRAPQQRQQQRAPADPAADEARKLKTVQSNLAGLAANLGLEQWQMDVYVTDTLGVEPERYPSLSSQDLDGAFRTIRQQVNTDRNGTLSYIHDLTRDDAVEEAEFTDVPQ